jgi:hypothetical protein
MDASDLLLHRTALIGAAVAMTIGLAGGLVLKVGDQDAPLAETAFASEVAYSEAQPIAWPSGKIPDYVLGTDFIRAQQPQPPVVVASYEVPEYVPAAWTEPTPEPQSARLVQIDDRERAWPSTGGDILNTRLPEDAPSPPEPPRVIEVPDAPQAAVPMTMAAIY